MKLKNKKVLVTGGTGLIGIPLVDFLLSMGAEVFCLTRKHIVSKNKKLKYIECDLKQLSKTKADEIKEIIGNIDYTIYLAASIKLFSQEKETMIEAKENNLDPFLNFLNLLGDLGKKIVFTSTADIYGQPKSTDFSESASENPLTTYAIAKLACEKYLQFYSQLNNKSYVILRLSQVYGPNEPLVRVIPFIINAALKNSPFIFFGNANNRRRFLFVLDVAQAIVKSIFYKGSGIFNIAGEEQTSIMQAIKVVEKISAKKIKIERKNCDDKQRDILPSYLKAEKLLGFKPEFSFEEGIREVLKNHENR